MQASDFAEVQRIVDHITNEAKRKELTGKITVLQRNVAAKVPGLYPRTTLGHIRREAERWIQVMQGE